jgi:short-subunit dehydrogenase
MTHQANKGAALITGASSGIGAVYADRLAKRGYDLILVARDEARLKTLAAKLIAETGVKVDVLKADLTQAADRLAVEQRLKTDQSLTLLVNNAGIGGQGGFADPDLDRQEALIDLNVKAVVRLAGAAIPGFLARGGGSVINVASVLAYLPGLLPGPYGATKAFVVAFSQSLQEELGSQGIYVQAVLPGATATEIWERSGLSVESMPAGSVMATDDLVDAALVGFDRGELITIPPLADLGQFEALEAARLAMGPNLSRERPAARYLQAVPA